ncbi:MAG TPA: prolipoprotein diacylglyceryl transferase, partial [Oceanospirillaceae bacterium]|nr:prolipoprotein diacylglyceryl transferase [Oceanospirillaceae bacterium]
DLIFFGALGAVLGGRMGYIFFYQFEAFVAQPTILLRVWEGGMSFHG